MGCHTGAGVQGYGVATAVVWQPGAWDGGSSARVGPRAKRGENLDLGVGLGRASHAGIRPFLIYDSYIGTVIDKGRPGLRGSFYLL
jgi:hypothetical protein